MKIALLQTKVYNDKERNIEEAYNLSAEAKKEGAEIAMLPEMFICPYENESFIRFAEEKGGYIYKNLSKIAKENSITLVGGSFPEKEGGRLYNTCFVFDKTGREIARHRKTHLFDVDVNYLV